MSEPYVGTGVVFGEVDLPVIDEAMSNIPEKGWGFQPCNGYLIHRIDDERYKAIAPFLYTHAIIVGRMSDRAGYDDRWCYSSAYEALLAATVWDGAEGTEPDGWHRNPKTGRRRVLDRDTGEVKEWVAW